jgi:hypothetical protein
MNKFQLPIEQYLCMSYHTNNGAVFLHLGKVFFNHLLAQLILPFSCRLRESLLLAPIPLPATTQGWDWTRHHNMTIATCSHQWVNEVVNTRSRLSGLTISLDCEVKWSGSFVLLSCRGHAATLQQSGVASKFNKCFKITQLLYTD